MDRQRFVRQFDQDGHALIEDVFDSPFVHQAKASLERSIQQEVAYHGGQDYADYGMVMCCAMYERIFIDLFDHSRLIDPFEWILGSGCIVYAYTSSSMPPDRGNFSTRIHVDCPRLIPGYVTNVGAIVCLDDFTADNGATWFLPGSQHREEAPTEEEFFTGAERLFAPAGAVWYFNTRLWHAGGVNHTNRWRHALTINMCRPYMKQRLDIPRLLQGRNLQGVSERALQKLGFHAQPPASVDEYYAPPNQRKFRQRYE